MSPAKEQLARLTAAHRADGAPQEIAHELAFDVTVRLGLADSGARRVMSNENVRQRIRLVRNTAYTVDVPLTPIFRRLNFKRKPDNGGRDACGGKKVIADPGCGTWSLAEFESLVYAYYAGRYRLI